MLGERANLVSAFQEKPSRVFSGVAECSGDHHFACRLRVLKVCYVCIFSSNRINSTGCFVNR
jgi:hypothetical protein